VAQIRGKAGSKLPQKKRNDILKRERCSSLVLSFSPTLFLKSEEGRGWRGFSPAEMSPHHLTAFTTRLLVLGERRLERAKLTSEREIRQKLNYHGFGRGPTTREGRRKKKQGSGGEEGRLILDFG